jgi:predicted DNA-binding transcriptional regulator YafY
VLVHAPASQVAAQVPPTTAVVEAVSAGSCLLTSGSDSLDSLAFHIAMLGFDFRVLEPAELAERMQALAERLLQAR